LWLECFVWTFNTTVDASKQSCSRNSYGAPEPLNFASVASCALICIVRWDILLFMLQVGDHTSMSHQMEWSLCISPQGAEVVHVHNADMAVYWVSASTLQIISCEQYLASCT
jgi:hypothetical protein